MTLPPVTVSMALYNDAANVGDAIRSVLAQTHRDFELLILDDGSTDGSLDVVRSFDDPRIRLLTDGVNRGLAARCNQTTDIASHDFIARIDSDDLMVPDRLAKQLRFLLANEDSDFVSTAMYQMTAEGKLLGCLESGRDELTLERLLRGGGGIAHGTILFRRDWLRRNRYREVMRRNEDADLWVRAKIRGDLSVGFINEPLTIVRQDENVRRDKLLNGFRLDREIAATRGIPRSLARKAVARSYLKALVVSIVPEPLMRRWLASRKIHRPPDRAMLDDFDYQRSRSTGAGS